VDDDFLDNGPLKRVVALRDVPSGEDAFGGHSSVARAIRGLVTTEPGGRTIGLEGGWGSGKSTIVRLFVESLPPTTSAYVFDTWAHEGDSLRRSFLEGLTEHLLEIHWIKESECKEDLEKLARRRRTTQEKTSERLTTFAKALALMVFLVPLASAILGRVLGETPVNRVHLGIAAIAVASPLLLALLFTVVHLARRVVDDNYKGELPITFLTRGTSTEQWTDTIEEPEPSSIEFADYFKKLIGAALRPKDRRLIVIFDNLDRVSPETAAVTLSTLQTFSATHVVDKEQRDRLWVLLPYDRDGLKNLWRDDKDLLRAFLDKIRELRFFAPPLVLSDWRQHLRSLLEDALPDSSQEEFDDVVRVLSAELTAGAGASDAGNGGQPPTPRELIVLVNEIGSSYRQRQEIPLSHVAYFAALCRRNEPIVRNLVAARLPSERVARMTSDELPRHIAALHFNVPAARAFQVLLSTRLESALLNGSVDALKGLAASPGLWEVFEGLPLAEWAARGGKDLLTAVGVLAGAGLLQDAPGGALKALGEASTEGSVWTTDSEVLGQGLADLILALRMSDADGARLLGGIGVLDIESQEPTALGQTDVPLLAGGLAAACQALVAAGRLPLLHLSQVSIDADAALFVEFAHLLSMTEGGKAIAPSLKPVASSRQIAQTLATWGETDGAAPPHAYVTLEYIYSADIPVDWNVVATAFGALMRKPEPVESAGLRLALQLIVLVPDRVPAFRELVAEGWIGHRLAEALNAADEESAALAAFIQMLAQPDLTVVGDAGNTAAGVEALRQGLDDPASFLWDRLDALCDAQAPQLAFVVGQARAIPPAWVTRHLQSLADADRLEATELVSHWVLLKKVLTQDALLRVATAHAIAGALGPALATTDDTTRTDVELVVLSAVNEHEEDLIDFSSLVAERLNELSRDRWEAVLDAGSAEIDLVVALGRLPVLALRAACQEALVTYAQHVLDGAQVVHLQTERVAAVFAALAEDHHREAVARDVWRALLEDVAAGSGEFYVSMSAVLSLDPTVTCTEPFARDVLPTVVRARVVAGLEWAITVLERSLDAFLTSEGWATYGDNMSDRIASALAAEADGATVPLQRLAALLDVAPLENDDEDLDGDEVAKATTE
jgi:hypothetical protein